VDSTTFLIICEALCKVKLGNLRFFCMHITSHFKVLCSVPPRHKSCVTLFNSMVYKSSNTLKICHLWCQNLSKTQSCTAAHQRHLRISGLNHPFSPGRAQWTHRFMRIQRRTELTAPVADKTDAHRTRSIPCAYSLRGLISETVPVKCKTGAKFSWRELGR